MYNKDSHDQAPDASSGDSTTFHRRHRSTGQWSARLWLVMTCLLLLGTNLLFGSGIVLAQATNTTSPTLVVSPTSFNGNTDCSYSQGQGWTCSATLSRGDSLSK